MREGLLLQFCGLRTDGRQLSNSVIASLAENQAKLLASSRGRRPWQSHKVAPATLDILGRTLNFEAPPLHPDTAWGVRWLKDMGKKEFVSDLDLAGGIRNGRWMDAETMRGIWKSTNTAYGSKVIRHLDLIDGIRNNVPKAIEAAEKNTLAFAFTKDGFMQYGSFAGIMEKYGPGVTTIERASRGLRRPSKLVLDNAQIQILTREFVEVGGDPKILRFNYGNRTGYVDQLDRINIRGDILPLEDAIHPRSTMSSRAVLSHELGHRNYRGTKLEVGAWNDEFRASYWAAKNAPGLSQMERVDLLNDAIMRAREAGVSIKLNSFMKETLYGY